MRRLSTHILTFSFVVLSALSCMEKVEVSSPKGNGAYSKAVTFEAEYEDSLFTKSMLTSKGGKVIFTRGDSIGVYGAEPFVCTSTTPSTSTIKGTLTKKVKSRLMVYPATGVTEWKDSMTALISLPSRQSATVSSFGTKANLSVALLNENDVKVGFRNVLASIRFTTSLSSPVFDEIRLEALDGEPLCGDFVIGANATLTPCGNNSSVLSLDGPFNEVGNYYLMLPSGDYSKGLRVSFLFDGVPLYSRTITPTTFSRSVFRPYGEITIDTSYISSDYSLNKTLTCVHQATVNNPLTLVVMGDGFSDRQIRSGLFYAYAKDFLASIFSEKILHDNLHCFDIYILNTVSKGEGYEGDPTALGLSVSSSGIAGTSLDKIKNSYLTPLFPSRDIREICVAVLLNSSQYQGLCVSREPLSGDYGRGLSVSYVTLDNSPQRRDIMFRHEYIGHAIAKLADEYAYNTSTIPSSEKTRMKRYQNQGWYSNIDFTSSTSSVRWASFLTQSEYSLSGFGIFEGGERYGKGVYRPTQTSIMRTLSPQSAEFNAVHRYAVFRRLVNTCHLSGFRDSFSSFVEFDRTYNEGGQTLSKEEAEAFLPSFVVQF